MITSYVACCASSHGRASAVWVWRLRPVQVEELAADLGHVAVDLDRVDLVSGK